MLGVQLELATELGSHGGDLRARRCAQLRTAGQNQDSSQRPVPAGTGIHVASAAKGHTSEILHVDNCLPGHHELQRSRSSSTVSYSDDEDFEDDSAAAQPTVAEVGQQVAWSEDGKRFVVLLPTHMLFAE